MVSVRDRRISSNQQYDTSRKTAFTPFPPPLAAQRRGWRLADLRTPFEHLFELASALGRGRGLVIAGADPSTVNELSGWRTLAMVQLTRASRRAISERSLSGLCPGTALGRWLRAALRKARPSAEGAVELSTELRRRRHLGGWCIVSAHRACSSVG